MWVYIARRLLWLPVLLLAVSFVTFALGRFGPGDPVQVILGARYEEETADRLREQLGLNRPFFVQYGDYVWKAMRGDLGESIRFRGRAVSELLGAKMWVSFQVSIAALIVSVGLGLPLGFWVAHKQGRWEDPTVVSLSLVLMSIPIMVTIPFMLWAFCLKLSWLPCSGWGGFWDVRIIIPAITMGIPGVAGLARLMRASTLDVMGQDFIRTARAKGLSEARGGRAARAQELAHSGGHGNLAFSAGPAEHRHHHRAHLGNTRHGQPGDRRHIQQGLPGDNGHNADRRDGVRSGQPGGRHRVHADRPQDSLQLDVRRRAAFGRMGTDWQRVN